MKYLTWICTALSLSGAVLVAFKNPIGFVCWVLANMGWFYDAKKPQ